MVRSVSLELAAGGSVALLGPNGSGKSTLLKALNGLLPILAGEVWLGGDPLRALRPHEIALRVASVPQEEPVAFPFSVREIVTMGRLARSTGIFDTADDRRAAQEAIDRAGCEELAERSVMELSGGERQRALMARALAQEAPILLLDEPTSHLDHAHQLAHTELVREFVARGGAVLSAVHDLNLASRIADKAVLLCEGRLALATDMETLLCSRVLDDVYGVRFERIRAPSGRLIVLPEKGAAHS